MSDGKTRAIEQNIEKHLRRLEIASQVKNWLENREPTKLVGATLPAEHWYSEHVLINQLQLAGLTFGGYELHGIERKESVAISAIKHRPHNCYLIRGDFHKALTKQIVKRNSGIAQINENVDATEFPYNFIWADHCNNPTNTDIHKTADYMGMMENGLFYVTFNIRPRITDYETLCKTLNLSRDSLGDSLAKRLIKMAKTRGSNAKLVYNVTYRGGGRYSTNMLTLGFMIGNGCVKKVGVIVKDVREDETRKHNRQTHQRYKVNPKSFRYYDRKKKATGTKTTDNQKEQVRKLLDKGIDKDKIAERMGISRKCIGAIQAHHNNPVWQKEKR